MTTPASSPPTVEQQVAAGNSWYVSPQFEWANQPFIRRIYADRFAFFQSCLENARRQSRTAPLRFLDAGCGDGYWLQRLGAIPGLHLSGVDYNALRVERARKAAPTADITVSDLAAFTSASPFDVILFSQVIEHVQDDVRLLQHLRSLLAPDGILIIGTPNEGSWFHRWRNRHAGPTDHVHFYTEAVFRARLQAAGFVVQRVMREVFYPGNDTLYYRLTGSERGYRFLRWLTRVWPAECSDFYMECRRG